MSFKETSSTKSKYVRGVKRNQIIQRWLQGIEDPLYEVFPTKKEGKYIVKPREVPINNEVEEPHESVEIEELHESVEEPHESQPPPIVKLHKPRSRTSSSRTMSSSDSISNTTYSALADGNFAPQTINLEILEQLRSLGEELRNDRFKKEQKNFIKQVVNKELSKSRIRSKYIPDILVPENPNSEVPDITKHESETVIDEPELPICEPERPTFKSRIRR